MKKAGYVYKNCAERKDDYDVKRKSCRYYRRNQRDWF